MAFKYSWSLSADTVMYPTNITGKAMNPAIAVECKVNFTFELIMD